MIVSMMLCSTHFWNGLQGFLFLRSSFPEGETSHKGVQMRFLSRLGNDFQLRSKKCWYELISGSRCMNIITLLLSVMDVPLCYTEQRLSLTVLDGSLYMSLIPNLAVSYISFRQPYNVGACRASSQEFFFSFSRTWLYFLVRSSVLSRRECRSLWSAGNPRRWWWRFLVH